MAFIAAVPLAHRRSSSGVCCVRMSLSALKNAATAAAVAGAVLAAAPTVDASVFHFRAPRPANIGVRSERYLDSCPPTPNCVSSMANVYDSHYVPSWTYQGATGAKKSMAEAIADVTKVIEGIPGAEIITSRPTESEVGKGYYIYSEFETPLMGFVDDVEILFQPDGSTVEYRSASRIGENDLKANRTRIREIRVALQELDGRWASSGY